MDEWITIGKVVKPVGLCGELKVMPLSDVPGRFSGLPHCKVSVRLRSGESRACVVGAVRELHHSVFLSFEGVGSIGEAACFSDGELRVARSEVPAAPEGVYYHFDLIGLTVMLEGGRPLGRIEQILETPANDVFVVRNGESEHLIPALRAVVARVDLTERTMVIRPVEGMVNTNDL